MPISQFHAGLVATLILASLGLFPTPIQAGIPGPQDPVGYYQDLQRAELLLRDGDFEKAGDLYQALTLAYGENGETWHRLADCRYSQKRYQESAAAYATAARLGVPFPLNAIYNAACCYALAGDIENAFLWLEKAVDSGWENRNFLIEDTDLAVLHADPRWVALAGVLPDREFTRDEGWRYDLRFFQREIDRMHPDPYRLYSREAFEKAFDSLDHRIPDLSDEQVYVELQKIVVMLGDGHSRIRPRPGSRVQFASIPLHLYFFADGLFVIDAESEDLVGSEVVAIGGKPVQELIEGTHALISRDNEMSIRSLAPLYLTLPAMLGNLGAADEGADVSVTLRNASQELFTVTLSPNRTKPGHRHQVQVGLATKHHQGSLDLPLYLARKNEPYWSQALPEADATYVQFNSVRNSDDVPLSEFARGLGQELHGSTTGNLILDIRHNGGGNSFLYPPLVKALMEFENRPDGGQIYVLAGRQTFSAAQNFATDVDTWTNAVFAGEPTGSSPSFIGESTQAVLPYSKLHMGISSRFHQQSYPGDERPWIAPKIPVSLTSADYFANRDPVLEAVIAVIKSEKNSAD